MKTPRVKAVRTIAWDADGPFAELADGILCLHLLNHLGELPPLSPSTSFLNRRCSKRRSSLPPKTAERVDRAAYVVESVFRKLDRRLVGHIARKYFAANVAEWLHGIPRPPCASFFSVLEVSPEQATTAISAGCWFAGTPAPEQTNLPSIDFFGWAV